MLLLLIALGVGALIGAVGIGGILLIPAVNLLGGLPIHQAMATSLFSFVFTGLAGTWLFHRRGSIDWAITRPLCLGAAVFAFLGAWANSKIDAFALALILSLLIAFAGLYTLWGPRGDAGAPLEKKPSMRRALLTAIGAVVGFGSGLTGVGGPALSVPIMMLFGFSPLSVIGASQAVQVLAALSGTLANSQFGSIDFTLAAKLSALEVLGVAVGVRIVHAIDHGVLRRFVGALCVLVGTGLTLRCLLA